MTKTTTAEAGSVQVLTRIEEGARWDIRRGYRKLSYSRATAAQAPQSRGEWIGVSEAIVERYDGKWLVTRWAILWSMPRREYVGTLSRALIEARSHVGLRSKT